MIKLTSEAEKVCVAKAEEARQGHIFNGWDTLTPEAQRTLIAEVGSVDFRLLERLVHEHLDTRETSLPAPGLLRPAIEENLPRPETSREDFELCRTLGEYSFRNGEVLFVTAAGGSSQPLFDKPLGLLPVGPVSSKSLLQLFAEKIHASNRRYRRSARWTLVCHPGERAVIAAFLKDQGHFGLPSADVNVTDQDLFPIVDRRGKILLSAPGRMAMSPTGHGGVLHRMLEDGRIEALESAGIRYIFYFHIDNPLTQLSDAVFLGQHIKDNLDVSSKVVRRVNPAEKVGVFCLRNGSLQVIEHTELAVEDRDARAADGSLAFAAANTGIHLFSLSFLRRLREDGSQLPFHCVDKETSYLGRGNRVVRPSRPNSFKFVTYAFDAIPFAARTRIVRVEREEEFSPIKCPSGGSGSLESARLDLSRMYGRWLARAVSGHEPRDDRAVEISPLLAESAEELKEKAPGTLPKCGGILFGGAK